MVGGDRPDGDHGSTQVDPARIEEITRIVLQVIRSQETPSTSGFLSRVWGSFVSFVSTNLFKLLVILMIVIGLVWFDVPVKGVIRSYVDDFDEAQRTEEKLNRTEQMANRHTELGYKFFSIGHPGAAKTEFQQALGLDPVHPRAEEGLLMAKTFIPIHRGAYDLEVAEQRLTDLLPDSQSEESIDDSYVHAFLGDIFSRLGTEEGINIALREYQKAIELNGRNAHAFAGMGIIKQQQGQLSEALEMYEKAQSISTWSPEYLNNIAYIYYQRQQYDLAIAQYEQLVRFDPFFIVPYSQLAHAYRLRGLEGDLRTAYTYQVGLLELLEDEDVTSQEKNQFPVFYHTGERLIFLSEDYQKRYYAYYSTALTSYMLKNGEAESYVSKAEGLNLDANTRSAVRSLVRYDIEILQEEQPSLESKTNKFSTKFL